jgi:hypothetical protein
MFVRWPFFEGRNLLYLATSPSYVPFVHER